jgi:outer membrane protein OmpA-like peptidoglycan-associated protein
VAIALKYMNEEITMNIANTGFLNRAGASLLVALMTLQGCTSTSKAPDGATEVREKLLQLQANSQLATLAPVAIKEAEAAVTAAEQPTKDKDLARHRVDIADAKVETAIALAKGRYLEDQRKNITDQRNEARLDARTREAELAKADADAARRQAEELQKQLTDLNAKTTERGLIVTLGDVLFETGRAELKGGATANLGKLAAFLNQYPERNVIIEGHTDSVGSESYNQSLSERRADSVKAYLVGQGIAATRLTSVGKGESVPVASNDSTTGRQMNRRVEVIIANPAK